MAVFPTSSFPPHLSNSWTLCPFPSQSLECSIATKTPLTPRGRQALRERVHHEELTRIKETQCFQRDLSTMLDTLESRIYLWVEERLQEDRAVADEDAKRTQVVSEHVQGILDESLTAVSKDMYSFRRESRSRNIPANGVLDNRLTGVGPKVTKIDDGLAMTRQLDLLSRETDTRIGEMERRVRKVPRTPLQRKSYDRRDSVMPDNYTATSRTVQYL